MDAFVLDGGCPKRSWLTKGGRCTTLCDRVSIPILLHMQTKLAPDAASAFNSFLTGFQVVIQFQRRGNFQFGARCKKGIRESGKPPLARPTIRWPTPE